MATATPINQPKDYVKLRNPTGGGLNLLRNVKAESEAIGPKRQNTRANSSPLLEPKGHDSPIKAVKPQRVPDLFKSPCSFPKSSVKTGAKNKS